MRIAILSRNEKLFSCNRLFDAAKIHGHQADIIDPLSCYLKVSNDATSSIFYHDKRLENYDAVIPRVSPLTTTIYSISILRQLEMFGCFPLNKSTAIIRAWNKLHTLQVLAYHNIDFPITAFSDDLENSGTLINIVKGVPFIIKLIEGAQGMGVILAETQQGAESILDTLYRLKVQFLVQEFISEANGCDIRCFVIGNKVIAAVERKSKIGDFRSNLHRGGTVRPALISSTEEEIAIRSTIALGLNVAGVDILRANRGPLVIEVNASPGLKGIETVSKLNIADLMISFIETCFTTHR